MIIPPAAEHLTLVDSHCHLDFPDFEGNALQEAFDIASDHGVRYMQTICTRVSQFQKIAAVAPNHTRLFRSVGQHPCNVTEDTPVTAQELIDIAARADVIGIGETGLDYYHDTSAIALQQSSFREHIKACAETGLPVIVHTRDAEDDTLAILQDERKKYDFPILIHCFTASLEFARHIIDMGGFISISGIVTFKNAKDLHEAVTALPLERLLVETDAPYLAPMPYRGKRNTPGYTYFAAAKIAELKNIPLEDVAEATTQNFFRLFRKAIR